jgi:hypothetical protein
MVMGNRLTMTEYGNDVGVWTSGLFPTAEDCP